MTLFSRMKGGAKACIVIESPIKIDALRAALKACGVPTKALRFAATFGHVAAGPRALLPISINRRWDETARELRIDPEALSVLVRAISASEVVVLATDNDDEGEAIAFDVLELVGDRPVFRVRFPALDTESVLEGFEHARSYDSSEQALSVPARARRVLDRAIGSALSDFDSRVYAGRVQNALLSIIALSPLEIGEANLVAADRHGGPPFVCRVPITSRTSAEAAHIFGTVKLPATVACGRELKKTAEPMNFADLLVCAAKELGTPVAQTARAAQALFEAGRISYPRVADRRVSRRALFTLERQARERSIGHVNIEDIGTCLADDAHEAIRLAGTTRVPVEIDPRHYPVADALCVLIARNALRCVCPLTVEVADTSAFPAWARALRFERVLWAGLPFRETPASEGMTTFPPDSVLVRAMDRYGVGRPSTFVMHAAKFLERDLVDSAWRLTEHGERWMRMLPAALLDVQLTARMEGLLDTIRVYNQVQLDTLVNVLFGGEGRMIEKIIGSLESSDVKRESVITQALDAMRGIVNNSRSTTAVAERLLS